MNKFMTKLLGAGTLSLAAMGASMPVSAAVDVASTQFPCPPNAGFLQCYAGSVVGSLGDSVFDNLDIGFVALSGLTELLGATDTQSLDLDSVTLSMAGTSVTADTDSFGEFSFDELASGTYRVSISGVLTHPDRFPQQFGHDDFRFRAGIFKVEIGEIGQRVVPQIPEPETYALMLAGLLTMFGLSRRRSQR